MTNSKKDSFFWSKVENNCIPKFALRAGYDFIAKQFSYIGRMKFTSLLKPQSTTTASALTNPLTTTNLMGSLTHVYEYIPAIVFGLHDLSFLDETFLLNFSQDQNNNTNNDNNNNNETVNNGNTNRQTESFWSGQPSITRAATTWTLISYQAATKCCVYANSQLL